MKPLDGHIPSKEFVIHATVGAELKIACFHITGGEDSVDQFRSGVRVIEVWRFTGSGVEIACDNDVVSVTFRDPAQGFELGSSGLIVLRRIFIAIHRREVGADDAARSVSHVEVDPQGRPVFSARIVGPQVMAADAAG